jgi:hypothetical protein
LQAHVLAVREDRCLGLAASLAELVTRTTLGASHQLTAGSVAGVACVELDAAAALRAVVVIAIVQRDALRQRFGFGERTEAGLRQAFVHAGDGAVARLHALVHERARKLRLGLAISVAITITVAVAVSITVAAAVTIAIAVPVTSLGLTEAFRHDAVAIARDEQREREKPPTATNAHGSS